MMEQTDIDFGYGLKLYKCSTCNYQTVRDLEHCPTCYLAEISAENQSKLLIEKEVEEK